MTEATMKKETEKPPIKAVIFDLDGLLIDSEPLWSEGRRQLLRQYGADYNPEDKKMTMGRDYREGVSYIINHHNLPLTFEEYAEKEKELLDRLYEQNLKLMPGVSEFQKKLDHEHIPKAIATSSSRKRLSFVARLVGLGDFKTSVTGDEITNGKPAPDIFLKVAEKLGVKPDDCVVIEDSPFGIMAARAAGMKSVAVYDSRFTTEEDFQDSSKPDLLVDSLNKLNVSDLENSIK